MSAEARDIPVAIRAAVDARDRLKCRLCGKYLGDRRALHHIDFGGDARGMGGLREHTVNNLVTLCWLPGDNDCHQRVHRNKGAWAPLLRMVVRTDGVTALQLLRWKKRKGRPWTRR